VNALSDDDRHGLLRHSLSDGANRKQRINGDGDTLGVCELVTPAGGAERNHRFREWRPHSRPRDGFCRTACDWGGQFHEPECVPAKTQRLGMTKASASNCVTSPTAGFRKRIAPRLRPSRISAPLARGLEAGRCRVICRSTTMLPARHEPVVIVRTDRGDAPNRRFRSNMFSPKKRSDSSPTCHVAGHLLTVASRVCTAVDDLLGSRAIAGVLSLSEKNRQFCELAGDTFAGAQCRQTIALSGAFSAKIKESQPKIRTCGLRACGLRAAVAGASPGTLSGLELESLNRQLGREVRGDRRPSGLPQAARQSRRRAEPGPYQCPVLERIRWRTRAQWGQRQLATSLVRRQCGCCCLIAPCRVTVARPPLSKRL